MTSKTMLGLSLLLSALSALGCAHARLQVEPPPERLHAKLAPQPNPPKAQEMAGKASDDSAIDVVAARELPDFREKYLGLASFDSLGRAPGNLTDVCSYYMSYSLLKRGVTRFVELSSIKDVGVILEKSSQAAVKPGQKPADREQTQWKSSLDRMSFLGRTTRADYVLYGTFIDIGSGTEQVETRYTIPDSELDRYSAAVEAWRGAVQLQIDAQKNQMRTYQAQFAQAERKYLDAGGTYQTKSFNAGRYSVGENGNILAEGDLSVELDSAEEALVRKRAHDSYMDEARAEIRRLEQALDSIKSPEQIADAVYGQGRVESHAYLTADLWVKLLEVDSGEVVWGARIRQKVAGAKPGQTHKALFPTLGKTLDLLLANSGSRAGESAVSSAPPAETGIQATTGAAAPLTPPPAAGASQPRTPMDSVQGGVDDASDVRTPVDVTD